VSLAGDTTANALPLGRTVLYSVSLEPTASDGRSASAFQLTGSVDSVAVTIPERIPTPTAGSNSKPRFHGALAADGHVIDLVSDATTSCRDAVDPLSAAATSLFIALPAGISPKQSWSDTVTTVTCRGRMPLVATVTRHYTAITDTVWGGRAALLITRHDSLDIRNRPDSISQAMAESGSVLDTTQQMTAAGVGRSDFTVYVDPGTGLLLAAIGVTHTEILVTTGSSRYPFREEARLAITLLQ
jgi:hypothetical protein